MDMNTAFDLEVQMHCPKARVIYDLFHVIAKYGREVIDRVRVDEANRHKQNLPRSCPGKWCMNCDSWEAGLPIS